nr:acetylxylan esterase [Streptomyces malaysiense]
MDPAEGVNNRVPGHDRWAHPDKTIEVYEFDDHEGGGPFHDTVKTRRLPS